MADLAAQKAALRAQARALDVPPPEAADALLAHLLARPELHGGGVLALFAALPGEPPVERAAAGLRARGWRTAYPRIEGDALALHRIDEEAQLCAGRPREPGAGTPRVDAVDVAVWLVPGLLFARDGARLGRGGGHYDRLLARAAPGAPRIGICYADRVREALPTASHDVRVHWIATQEGVLRAAP